MSDGVRAPKRPAGWIAPGPPPAGARGLPELAPEADEDLCLLSGDWRIFQKRRGHRWSLDDLVTAWVACAGVTAARALDLGCGVGSVLMMVAWRFPEAQVVGIEAQEASARMARRSLAYNGADGRVVVRSGDLRDPALVPEESSFDLVTGTPPYFAAGEGVEPRHAQSASCRFEKRGGVADYCAAAARALAPSGRFVLCAGALEEERVREGAQRAGLAVGGRLHVVPRAGKEPLVHVFTMARGAHRWPAAPASLVVRDTHGAWTAEFACVRRDMGMPDRPPG